MEIKTKCPKCETEFLSELSQPLLTELGLQPRSPEADAKLADAEKELLHREEALTALNDMREKLARQISTPEGFAELARAAHLFDSEDDDLAFINFANTIGKGHLVKYLSPGEEKVALKDLGEVYEADELVLIGEALEREEAREVELEKAIASALKNS